MESKESVSSLSQQPLSNIPREETASKNWLFPGIILSLSLLILLLVGYSLFVVFHKANVNVSSAAVPTSMPTNTPQMKITDLAPGVSASQKTVLVVQHSDSSMEKIIIKSDLVSGYIKSLPEGERVVSQVPYKY